MCALIKNGLMRPASDKVSSVWQLSHKPGTDDYGNDSARRGQAGQPVVLSLALCPVCLSGEFRRLSESSFCYLKRYREFSQRNSSILPQI